VLLHSVVCVLIAVSPSFVNIYANVKGVSNALIFFAVMQLLRLTSSSWQQELFAIVSVALHCRTLSCHSAVIISLPFRDRRSI